MVSRTRILCSFLQPKFMAPSQFLPVRRGPSDLCSSTPSQTATTESIRPSRLGRFPLGLALATAEPPSLPALPLPPAPASYRREGAPWVSTKTPGSEGFPPPFCPAVPSGKIPPPRSREGKNKSAAFPLF